MKSSLWAVIAIVTGLVGFLMGYSTSAYTGVRKIEGATTLPVAAATPVATPSPPPAAGGYGNPAPKSAAPAQAPAPAAGGYR